MGGPSNMGSGGPGGGPPRMLLPPEFDNRPFDNAVAQLRPQYLGCDPELAYTRIRNGIESGKRGEIAILARQQLPEQASRLPVPPTLDLESIYAFRFNPEDRFYDRHYLTLKVYVPFSNVLQN